MPQDPRPKLRPVAGRTDPFVNPGVAQPRPALGGFNFEALRGLSKTLSDYESQLQTNQDRAERENRLGQADNSEANANRVLLSTQEAVLNSVNIKDPDTLDAIAALKKAGIKDADNPLSRMDWVKGSALRVYNESRTAETLLDPAFVTENASIAVMEGEDKADAVFQQELDKQLEKIGRMDSPLATETVRSKVYMLRQEFMAEREKMKDNVAKALADEYLANAVLESVQGSTKAFINGNEESGKASVGALITTMEGTMRKTGDRTAVMNRTVSQLETAHMDMLEGHDDNALHSFDMHRDALQKAFPLMTGALVNLQAKLTSESERIKRKRDTEDGPEARAIAQGRIDAHLSQLYADGKLGSFDAANNEIFRGEAIQKILDEVAASQKVNVELLSSVRASSLERWGRRNPPKASDEKVMRSILDTFSAGEPDKALILLQASGDSITIDDYNAFSSTYRTEKARASSGTQERRDRDTAFENYWGTLGTAPAEAGNRFLPAIKNTFDQAYRTYLDANPADEFGAKMAAQEAANKTNAFSQFKEAQRLVGGASLVSSSDFNSRVIGKAVRILDEQLRAETAANPEVISSGDLERKENILSQLRAEMSGPVYESVSKRSDILALQTQAERHVATLNAMDEMVSPVLKKIVGLGRGAKKDIRTAKLNSKDQLMRFGSMDISKSYIKKMTPPGMDKGTFTFTDGAQTAASSAIQSFLLKLQDGSDRPFESKPTGGAFRSGRISNYNYNNNDPATKLQDSMTAAATDTVIAMSEAVLRGGPLPQDTAGDHRLGDMAAGVGNLDDARKMLRAATTAIGLTPQEVADGKLRTGVDLEDVWGEPGVPWSRAISPRNVPFFPDLKSVEAGLQSVQQKGTGAVEAKMMIALGLDPTDGGTVTKFFEWQRELATKRDLRGSAATSVRNYFKNIPAPQPGEPQWAKNRRDFARRKD